MAKDNIEIEVKTAIAKSDFIRIKNYLKKESKFIKTSIQEDTYYSPPQQAFLKPRWPYEWLSIRERDGKVILNYKHWYPEGVKNTTHCDEYQTEVTDKKQLETILKALKFDNLVTVKKRRLVFENGDLEISLDDVKGLGFFIEIESIRNSGGLEKVRQRILNFAASLGINVETIIPGGYAAEMMRRKGLMK